MPRILKTGESQQPSGFALPATQSSSSLATTNPASQLQSFPGTTTPNPLQLKNVPAFLNKLFSMVNDSDTDGLIHWAPEGDSFIGSFLCFLNPPFNLSSRTPWRVFTWRSASFLQAQQFLVVCTPAQHVRLPQGSPNEPRSSSFTRRRDLAVFESEFPKRKAWAVVSV